MDPNEASRQINQMVEFIKQEAREKADEIRLKTDQEFNIAKLSHIEQAKQTIRDEFDKKKKEKITKSKIARSFVVQKARHQLMEHQEQLIQKLKSSALEKLIEVSALPEYESLVEALIIQTLIRLRENKVSVRCREKDLAITQRCMDSAGTKYSAIVDRDIGIAHSSVIELDDEFLPPPPSEDMIPNSLTCAGGVEVLALRKKIVISNTLDRRLDLCFDDLKPTIRELLWKEKLEVN